MRCLGPRRQQRAERGAAPNRRTASRRTERWQLQLRRQLQGREGMPGRALRSALSGSAAQM